MTHRLPPIFGTLGQTGVILASLGADISSPAHAQTEQAPAGQYFGAPLPYQYQPQPPPLAPPPSRQPLVGLAIGGAATLGATWAISIATAAICDTWNYHFDHSAYDAAGTPKCDTWPLYFPVLGPWLTLGVVHTSGSPPPFVDMLLVLDGLGQAAGLAMIIGGAVGRSVSTAPAKNDLQVIPLALRGGSGVLLSGRF